VSEEPGSQLNRHDKLFAMSSKYDDKLFKGAKASIFENARQLRKELTPAEDMLWQELRNRKLNGLKFRRQHPINNYVADFYCCEKRFIVEVDGGIHHEKEQRDYDEARTKDLGSMGIEVLRFTNNEVENEMPDVLKRILDFARKEDKK
jgi:very-short-patch-repair endonuclease